METEQCQQGFDGLHGFKPPPEGTTALNDHEDDCQDGASERDGVIPADWSGQKQRSST